jgi:hypothetical protein
MLRSVSAVRRKAGIHSQLNKMDLRISSASRRKRGALRSIRGTPIMR